MEASETSMEGTAGQTAAAGTESAAATSGTAVETATATAKNTTESTAAAQDRAEVTQEQITATTTQEPAQDTESACPSSGCDPMTVGIILGVVVIAVALVALLAKKKKGKKPASGKAPKTTSTDVVEIYVGNLSYDMNDAQLRREFERFGVVKSARVITHRTNGKSKGYGFVEMPHRKEAVIGIKALDNSEVMGRRIRVNEARANTRPPER